MVFGALLSYPQHALRFLFLSTPDGSPWAAYILLWIMRLVTLSLIFRTYVGPWILKRLSGRIQVRSVSLRSIRGIYFRSGARTWHVDRIGASYRRPGKEGSSRLLIKIQGIKLEIGQDEVPSRQPSTRPRRGTISLGDLSPSPIARWLWSVVADIYALVEPYLRPAMRITFVAVLRVFIRVLHALTQHLDFELDTATVTFSSLPGTRITVREAFVHIELSFTQLEDVIPSGDDHSKRVHLVKPASLSMAAWKTRLSKSVGRNWERAWGKARGSVSLSLKAQDIKGLTIPPGRTFDSTPKSFFDLPGAIDFSSYVSFNPKRGTPEPQSLKTSLTMDGVFIVVDTFHSLLKKFQNSQPPSTAYADIPGHDCPAVGSPITPTTPMSPLLGALSTMRSSSRNPEDRHHRLSTPRRPTYPWVASLGIIEAQIAMIRLSCQYAHGRDKGKTHSHEASIRRLAFAIKLSDPASNPLHREHLGRNDHPDGHLNPSVYAATFSVDRAAIDRFGDAAHEGYQRLLSVGPADIDLLLSGWPIPWLSGSSFLTGDPNSAVAIFRMKIASLDITERLETLQALLSEAKPTVAHNEPSPLLPSILSPMPRIVIQLQCGSIQGNMICDGDAAQPHSLELRTDGFFFSAGSTFHSKLSTSRNRRHTDTSPVQMSYQLAFGLDPTFVRVRSSGQPSVKGVGQRFSRVDMSNSDIWGEPVLSLEAVEITGEGVGLGEMIDDTDSVSIDTSSLFLDVQCRSDALCIELWHPDVVASIAKTLAALRRSPPPVTRTSPSRGIASQLFLGVSAALSVTRFVVFVTGKDINPNDDQDLTRGTTFRTGFGAQYCALHARHLEHFRNMPAESQTRHKLYLPEHRIVDAINAAKLSTVTGTSSACLQILLWDTALRSAAATRYSPDNPLMAEREDPILRSREYLRIGIIQVDIELVGLLDTGSSDAIPPDSLGADACRFAVTVPNLEGAFEVTHVYDALTAAETLKSLLRKPDSSATRHSLSSTPTKLSYSIHANVTTLQILFRLSEQQLALRLDGLGAWTSSAETSPEIRWDNVVVWVPVPPNINRWDARKDEQWQELGRLEKWVISLPTDSTSPPTICINGDSAFVRIPYGYILADLILDASLTVKSLAHIRRMVAAGQYMDMPTPEAEEAKSIPNLRIAVSCLSLEAADDDIETKLALIWRAGGPAVKYRMDREEAFRAKVATILAASSVHQSTTRDLDSEYQFTAEHTVSIAEARERLSRVHIADWVARHQYTDEERSSDERDILRSIRRTTAKRRSNSVPNIVPAAAIGPVPPVFRAAFHDLLLHVTGPSFPGDFLPEFLHNQGSGIPLDTQYSLLIPMHINFTVSALRVTLRDYPIPMLDVPSNEGQDSVWEFDTDLVIAEEMGTAASVIWIDYTILEEHKDIPGSKGLSIQVPKTIMPVKTYASPTIRVTTDAITSLSWSVSYGPAIQDLMRVLETLSHIPPDTSPGVGFWDKIRLVFHWNFRISFKSDVRLLMKGSRDPYLLVDDGAGFALCWHGKTKIIIGHANEDSELMQVISDTMLIVIPDLVKTCHDISVPTHDTAHASDERPKNIQKIVAKLTSGVRFGIGFVLERTCGEECLHCTGSPFHRACRHFDFRPHYDVKLEMKEKPPALKDATDSYNAFRSDFIHLSISLTSSVRSPMLSGANPSSIHLTPKVFARFWSWWELFDGVLTLPIRQGTLFPPRHMSPKFGRHLATLKYRISIAELFISHAYIDESRESWIDGITPFIGVKARIDHFQADLHQRDQETTVPGPTPDDAKVTRHKPFYSAEVVLKGLDLRALLAIFEEPVKKSVPVASPPEGTENYRTRNEMPITDPSSPWIDMDDFYEIDWVPPMSPTVHLLPAASCPHFTYFKRHFRSSPSDIQTSKFGTEDTHRCLLGKESSVPQIQIHLASARISELKQELAELISGDASEATIDSLRKMLSLLEDYVAHLHEVDVASASPGAKNENSYYMPSDSVSPDEWAEFENVFQVHNPKIFITNAIRDVMAQYYYCSRARRGFEYHLAARAVKFIRDQAKAAPPEANEGDARQRNSQSSSAQAAAMALRKFLGGDAHKTSVEVSDNLPPRPSAEIADPMSGWSDGVSLRKSHFCLLLKPQVVLRCEAAVDSICVLAAVQAKLQAFSIMDDSNAEDPVSGKVMSRSYTSLNGLQAFSPAKTSYSGDGRVPLEVMIDFRCESSDFDRLVPQTDATFQYDKFNRLRLRNNVTSVARKSTSSGPTAGDHSHLHNQNDLIQVQIPRFTVAASDMHFQAIANVVTKLVLFSDPTLKTRLDKLETLLFTYDFTDLASAADVVANLQGHLRSAIETERSAFIHISRADAHGKLELLKLRAHIFLLAEELNCIFDAIKLAQDRIDEHSEQKSALLLHALSSEISWRMLDGNRDLLAKVAMRDIDFFWLDRQDSSAVNHLEVSDLQAFDGSPHAVWAEILSKHMEPMSHPMCKKEVFMVADWTVLAPVGGITIYEQFEVNLHPMRLQLDARVGSRIMEYVWPARRNRGKQLENPGTPTVVDDSDDDDDRSSRLRASLDSSHERGRKSLDSSKLVPPDARPPLRRLGVSRSFTDLRSAASELHSSPSLRPRLTMPVPRAQSPDPHAAKKKQDPHVNGDAAEMKTRSSQKTFVYVKISSLHLLLSVLKEESFECRDALIRTRDLEYRNQTWSFEELVDQFIPSNTSWRGWVKMAFNQPLIPVMPVARELLSKTKWINSKGSHVDGPLQPKLVKAPTNLVEQNKGARRRSLSTTTLPPPRALSPGRRWKRTSHRDLEPHPPSYIEAPFTAEPESLDTNIYQSSSMASRSRSRMKTLFSRKSSRTTSSSNTSVATLTQSSHSSGSIFSRRSSDRTRNSGSTHDSANSSRKSSQL